MKVAILNFRDTNKNTVINVDDLLSVMRRVRKGIHFGNITLTLI